MEKLHEKYHKVGLYQGLLKRTDSVAMYGVYADSDHKVLTGFEVFKIKVLPPGEIFGKPLPEREHYHSSEEFGKTGWSLAKKKEAERYFDSLTENQI